jgi:hypothetical protein
MLLGGMGEVYRARDGRLDCAVKILPAAVSGRCNRTSARSCGPPAVAIHRHTLCDLPLREQSVAPSGELDRLRRGPLQVGYPTDALGMIAQP